MSKVDRILQFWFGQPGNAHYQQFQQWWFQPTATTDRQLRDLFAADYELAAAGYLDGWQGWPQSCLALILLLDQLPRNLFRGSAKALGTDAQALAIAKQAVQDGFDRDFAPIPRWFFYLPFEHSEQLPDQEQSLLLFRSLPDHPEKQMAIAYAEQHHQIVREFGRFPHRNAWLGRASTPAEQEYLQRSDAFHG